MNYKKKVETTSSNLISESGDRLPVVLSFASVLLLGRPYNAESGFKGNQNL